MSWRASSGAGRAHVSDDGGIRRDRAADGAKCYAARHAAPGNHRVTGAGHDPLSQWRGRAAVARS